MTEKYFDQIIEDLKNARARETKNRAVELMKQELIQKIIEMNNAFGLSQILGLFNESSGTYMIYLDFLKKAMAEKGITKKEDQEDYTRENREVLDEDF